MKYLFNYKNFTALVEYVAEDKIYIGKVINTKDTITFYTQDFDKIEEEFHLSVDDYLEWLEELES